MVIDTRKGFRRNKRYISSSPEFEDEEMRATAEKNKWDMTSVPDSKNPFNDEKEERSLSEL